MNHMTKAIIIGRVGKIIPLNGVTKISIASNDPYKNKETGEWVVRTRWNTVSVFKEGLCKYVNEKLEVGSLI